MASANESMAADLESESNVMGMAEWKCVSTAWCGDSSDGDSSDSNQPGDAHPIDLDHCPYPPRPDIVITL